PGRRRGPGPGTVWPMTTDDLPPTDAWALDRADEASAEGTDDPWVLAGRLVLGDDDVVACAAGAVRASASGHGFSMWLIALDEQSWSTGVLVQVTDLTDVPRPGEPV